ncbi:MAG: hypothetical protein WCK53_09530 [Methanomicrobiales archaeon]
MSVDSGVPPYRECSFTSPTNVDPSIRMTDDCRCIKDERDKRSERTTPVVNYGEGIHSVNGIGKTFDIRERIVRRYLKIGRVSKTD